MADITRLRIRCDTHKSKLLSLINFIDAVNKHDPTTYDIDTVFSNFTIFKGFYNKFDEACISLLSNVGKDSVEYAEIVIEIDDVFDKYKAAIAKFEKVLDKRTASQSKPDSESAPKRSISFSHTLPQMNLPTFDGKIENWDLFRDNFVSLVHNNPILDDNQRFHYLKTSLMSDGLKVLQSLKAQDQKYTIVWNLLNQRFQNRKLMTQHHLKSFVDMPVLNNETSEKLRNISDDLSKHVSALEDLVPTERLWDTLLLHIASSKLCKETHTEWLKSSTASKDYPTFRELIDFINSRAQLFETIHGATKASGRTTIKGLHSQPLKCSICKKEHLIYKCEKLLSLSVSERLTEINNKKLCHNCLFSGHRSRDCKSKYNCRTCHQRHHTLLHIQIQPAPTVTQPVSQIFAGHTRDSSRTVLSTALVNVPDHRGDLHTARVLLDSGSQNSFITKEFADKLSLPTRKANTNVVGINNATTKVDKSMDICIWSTTTNHKYDLLCFILPSITGEIPTYDTEPIQVHHIPNNVKLADPHFNQANQIDVLLGADLFWELLRSGRLKLEQDRFSIQKTTLGWIVTGTPNSYYIDNTRCYLSQRQNIQNQLQGFWELENVPTIVPTSPEENACEEHFAATTSKLQNGHFCVDIPFKGSPHTLGDSKTIATKRFYNLERAFLKNDEFRIQYHAFIQEYIDLGHMTLNMNSNTARISYYLPHHGVTKATSTTTKLRVVFDGSMKTSTGVSLNDLQAVGPTIQNPLLSILLRFRMYQYILCADIAKMYRQVYVCPEQRDIQQILWRFSPEEPLQAYQLNTVTYGTASASFLAIRCLMQLGYENLIAHPEAANSILSDFYVDDLITGENTADELVNKGLTINDILQRNGFPLRKWTSNSLEVLSGMQIKTDNDNLVELGSSEPNKTLGIGWDPSSDQIKYSITKPSTNDTVTKRKILSFVGTIFDPLGLMQPCIIAFKILLQSLWKLNLDWDDPISGNVLLSWNQLLTNFELLNIITIPRCVLLKNCTNIQIHGFSDASEKAYGACVYMRSIDAANNCNITLLCSKSRVAPLKSISIPRLELCASLMLTRLISQVLSAIKSDVDNIYLWTDSTIVLSWLKLSPSNLHTFVANRVSEIQQAITPAHEWRHVVSEQNPADLISRGVTPELLQHCSLWWSGPKFLQSNVPDWPNTDFTLINIPEQRKVVIVNHTIQIKCDLFDKFSTLQRLQRVTAHCMRFTHNCRNPSNPYTGSLTAVEMAQALTALAKGSQQESFAQDLKMLRKDKCVSSSSKLHSLHPFMDNDHLIRVGGRLNNADLDYETKHPIVLSADHAFTKLVMTNEHLRLFHAGPQATLFSTREVYWPIGGTILAKRIVKNCITCFRHKPVLLKPIMGDLPSDRFSEDHPFRVTGVDYAGPIMIKNKPGRGCILIKSYICLFVCFATKAIHLELVTDLTTENFINALHRFVSRRGKPAIIHSDNGTNFVGANNLLKRFLNENSNKITDCLSSQHITWKFLPPRSPHHGGLWESNIKSTKSHLKRILGNAHFTYEYTYSVLVQIEAILNSRPLYPMSNDPLDLHSITPGHLLIGRSLTAIPMPNVADTKPQGLKLFRCIQQRTQHFWNRWRHDYLNSLQQRSKWKSSSGSTPQVGDLAILKEENLPPQRWTLARIIELIPGKDGVNRVALLKTNTGIIKRSLHNVAILPTRECKSTCNDNLSNPNN